jgi:predicted component of type VI protein secretion system
MNLMLKALVTYNGETTTRVFTEFPVRIGRDGRCELRIRHRRVSRQHARIQLAGHELVLLDESSRNGLVCNGAAVKPGEPVGLKDGDHLAMGSVSVTVRICELTEPMPLVPIDCEPQLELETTRPFPRKTRSVADAAEAAGYRREPTTVIQVRSCFYVPTFTLGPDGGFDAPPWEARPTPVSLDDVKRLAKPYMPEARPPTELGIDDLLEGLTPTKLDPTAGGSLVAETTGFWSWVQLGLCTLLARARAAVERVLRALRSRRPTSPVAAQARPPLAPRPGL